jgi:hypothetical protein
MRECELLTYSPSCLTALRLATNETATVGSPLRPIGCAVVSVVWLSLAHRTDSEEVGHTHVGDDEVVSVF